nr:putative leucine-rich repeat-containing protein DDB_G0290503 [Nothobranchius furzeri]
MLSRLFKNKYQHWSKESLLEELQKFSDENTELKRDIVNAKVKLQENIATAVTAETSALNTKLSDVNREFDRHLANASELTKRYSRLEDDYRDISDKCRRAEKKLNEFKSTHEANESLKLENCRLKYKISELNRYTERLEQQKQDLDSKVQNLTDDLKEKRRQVEELESSFQIEKSNYHKAMTEEKLRQNETKFHHLQVKVRDLENDLMIYKKQTAEKEETIQVLTEKNLDLTEKNNFHNDYCASKMKLIQTQKDDEMVNLKSTLTSCQKKHQNLLKETETYKELITRLKANWSNAQAEIQRLEIELKQLRNTTSVQMNQKNEEANQLKTKCSTLLHQIQQVKENLEHSENKFLFARNESRETKNKMKNMEKQNKDLARKLEVKERRPTLQREQLQEAKLTVKDTKKCEVHEIRIGESENKRTKRNLKLYAKNPDQTTHHSVDRLPSIHENSSNKKPVPRYPGPYKVLPPINSSESGPVDFPFPRPPKLKKKEGMLMVNL